MTEETSGEFLMALTRAYHLLSALSDRLHAAHGLSTGVRSVLLLLDRQGPRTLSEIARDRAVSRQFIQKLAQTLIARDLIVALPNAANRKSPRFALTPAGEQALATIREREAEVQEALASVLQAADLEPALKVLDRLNAALTDLKQPQA